jgi:hypothetical protein
MPPNTMSWSVGSPSISNPCDLSTRFIALRRDIAKIADTAKDAGNTAERLRRTSRHAPYKHVEQAWLDVTALSKPALDELSDFPSALSALSDSTRSRAALNLISADQSALERIDDYTHAAVAFERTENAMALQYRRTWGRDQLELSFSTPEMASRMRINLYARQQLNVRFTEVDDALRSLKIAEHHYGKACNAWPTSIATISDPCTLTHKLLGIHLSILQLSEEAHNAGSTAERLHKTSLIRPYNKIERAWFNISARSNTLLHTLSSLFISLSDAPNSNSKEATMSMIVAYQNSLEHIVHYTNYALYYERAENEASYNDTPKILTFGVTNQNNKAVVERAGSLLFDGAATEIGDAVRALKLPESSYASACDAHVLMKNDISVYNPCELTERFVEVRTLINDLKNEAKDAGSTAKGLHHTSRSVPYKRVEKEWIDVKKRADSLLDTLSDIPPIIRSDTNDMRKQAAMDVINAYQDSVEQIVDYTHLAVDYERAENSVSNRLPPLNFSMNFGVEKSFTRASSNNASRNVLEGRLSQIGDAVRSLKIPEYNYDKFCGASLASHGIVVLASSKTMLPGVNNPCAFSESFQSLHGTIFLMAQDADNAANTAVRIRNTPIGRPYKRIENNWNDLSSRVEPALDRLSNFPISLDAFPDGAKKDAALDLTGAYENAISQLADYGRSVLFFERTENTFSMKETDNAGHISLNFGVPMIGSKMSTRNAARNQLEGKAFEEKDALLSLRLPERRYGVLCHVSFSPSPAAQRTAHHIGHHHILVLRNTSGSNAM